MKEWSIFCKIAHPELISSTCLSAQICSDGKGNAGHPHLHYDIHVFYQVISVFASCWGILNSLIVLFFMFSNESFFTDSD